MLKLFEMFAGYGGASFALKKAGIPFECVGYSEIDKNAIKCYEQNFPDVKNFGDCVKIDTEKLPEFDLLTGGFPCQDVSIAGQRDLSKGRTNLYVEILRVAKAKQPKYMLLENVTGLLSMGKKGNKLNDGLLIDKIVRDLKSTGYGVCWKVLNSKDYGIPQNRERVWIVCKLGGWGFAEFQFPNRIPLKIFVKDLLELDIDAKYNLTEKQIKLTEERLNTSYESKFNPMVSNSLRTNYGNGFSNETYVGGIQFDISGKGYKGGITTPIVMNCLTEAQGRQGSSKEFLKASQIVSETLKYGKHQQDALHNVGGVSPTIPAGTHGSTPHLLKFNTQNVYRRLTPKECFRLQGFLNDEIKLGGLSDSAKYKLAGNGWEIVVASLLFKQLASLFRHSA